ncbi:MAG: hypothetical protein KDA38_15310, partial [Planctomycetales bacterium]|nr:hypothetical protein [Planctomycetales bacterium]
MKTTLAKSLAKSRLTLGLTCCLLALSALAPRIATADATIYQQALRSATWVLAKNSDGTSSGTGVLVDLDRKLVVTNAHVVGDARAAVLFFADLSDGQPNVSRQHYLDNVRK